MEGVAFSYPRRIFDQSPVVLFAFSCRNWCVRVNVWVCVRARARVIHTPPPPPPRARVPLVVL